jgi:hypothetical protein
MFQTVADRITRGRSEADLRRWLLPGVAALILAAGLVALGRWTAPSTGHTAQASAVRSQASGYGPGSIDPRVMPPRAVLQTLEHIYLGTPLPGSRWLSGYGPGSIDPAVMPPRAVQQTLERIYLGTPLPGNPAK